MESDEEEDDSNALSIPSEEMNTVIRDLTAKLENLKTCYDLISKHGTALQRALTDLESGEDLTNRSKIVSERATLFRISANAMINVMYFILIFLKILLTFWFTYFRRVVNTCNHLKIKDINGQKCYSTNVHNDNI